MYMVSTAWYLSNSIREACTNGINMLAGEAEVDETYIGGKRKNMSNAKRKELEGRGTVGKQPIMGMLERGGEVRVMPIKGAVKEVLHGYIQNEVKKGSTIYTDEWKAYRGLKGYKHEAVKHSAGEYVKGMVHTNGIESFCVLMKRDYIGSHHWWSIKHLHRYVSEYAYRRNTRNTVSDEALTQYR